MHDRSGEPVTADGYVFTEAEPSASPITHVRERTYFICNCWMFALWRLFRRGGFLIITKSEWGWWPHLMWSPDMSSLQQFEPTEKKRRRLLPPFVYKGYVKETRL